jgi:hypothetical protein
MNKKTIKILEDVIKIWRKSKTSLSCKEITIEWRKMNPKEHIAYRDMFRYISLLNKYLNIETGDKGRTLYYSLKSKGKIVLEYKFIRTQKIIL